MTRPLLALILIAASTGCGTPSQNRPTATPEHPEWYYAGARLCMAPVQGEAYRGFDETELQGIVSYCQRRFSDFTPMPYRYWADVRRLWGG